MDVEMSDAGAVEAAVARLRYLGFPDASAGNRRTGDPMHVVSVSVAEHQDEAEALTAIQQLDPGARRL